MFSLSDKELKQWEQRTKMWLARSRVGLWESKAKQKNEAVFKQSKMKEQTRSLSWMKNYIRRYIPYTAGKGTAKVIRWQLDFNRKRKEGLPGHYEPCQQVDIIDTRKWRGSAKREREQQEDEERHFSVFDLISQNTQGPVLRNTSISSQR